MVMQWPGLRTMAPWRSSQSSWPILPARSSASKRLQSVQDPNSWPRQWAVSCGPPVTRIAGTSALTAPMSSPGVVLSQPPRRTTPSRGLARMHSSTSMLKRFRKSMEVGRMLNSPNEMTGNSKGTPPACQTPSLTRWANVRRWALQWVNSLQVLQMPMRGRSRYTEGSSPSPCRAACRVHPYSSGVSNHSRLRRFCRFRCFNLLRLLPGEIPRVLCYHARNSEAIRRWARWPERPGGPFLRRNLYYCLVRASRDSGKETHDADFSGICDIGLPPLFFCSAAVAGTSTRN